MIHAWILALAAIAQSPPVDTPADASEYDARRKASPDTAEAHWKLALWCQSRSLRAEAEAEFASVIALDPKRDAAWKHLGYRKHLGRWMTEAQVVDFDAQAKADKHWLPALRKLHEKLHDKAPSRREEARAAFLKLDDPRAVPSLWIALAAGGPGEQELVTEVLAGIPGAASSRSLAALALFGKSEKVQLRATAILKGRDPADFAAVLVGLIRDPIKYEVKPVDGAGGRGVLFVEGEKFNVRQVYAPPAAPEVGLLPGDLVILDDNGLPVIHRRKTEGKGTIFVDDQGNPIDTMGMQKIEVGKNQVEAQNGAILAARQLEADVALIEDQNRAIGRMNDLAIGVLKAITKKDLGIKKAPWRAWQADVEGKAVAAESTRRKKTYDAVMQLAYQPSYSFAQPIAPAVMASCPISHHGSS